MSNQQNNTDKNIYSNFTLMEKEQSSRLASTILFFSKFVNPDGTPKNPKYSPCMKAAAKIRNLRILGRASKIPNLSETTQMELVED